MINISIKKLTAFTLAEVLITLGIIGIVAEMTIPTILQNTQEKEYRVSYKSAYSRLSAAMGMANANGDLTFCSTWFEGTCNQANFNAIKKYFKVAKDCGTDSASCWNMSGEKSWQSMGGYPTTVANSFIDASGSAWSNLYSSALTSPEIIVDTNGFKGPNQYGKDRAIFSFPYVSGNATSPFISHMPDCTGIVNANTPSAAEQLNRCPSYAKYACYYTSWLMGKV